MVTPENRQQPYKCCQYIVRFVFFSLWGKTPEKNVKNNAKEYFDIFVVVLSIVIVTCAVFVAV